MKRIALAILSTIASLVAAAETAPDIDMQTRQGMTYSLDSIRTPLTIVYFNDIDCDECHAVSDSLAASPLVSQLLEKGSIALLSVYIGDNAEKWKQLAPHDGWTECINPSLSALGSDEYRFDALPAMFVIDKQHNFLLNGTTVAEIEKFLIDKQNETSR